MSKPTFPLTNRWMAVALIFFLGILFFQLRGFISRDDNSVTNLSLRTPGYPATYIDTVQVDVTSPNHWVTLSWTGPNAGTQETGPFRSSPGKGLGTNDCNSVSESNEMDSNCTPKGRTLVEGLSDALPSNANATFVTWINMPRAIALHHYPVVPDYPDSSGCVRLNQHAAQLIHNNSIIGKTAVEVDGTWTRPIDMDKLFKQLISHEGRRWKVYSDSLGIPSIGVGFNLTRPDAEESIQAVGADYKKLLSGKEKLADHQIDKLLKNDVDVALQNCRKVFSNWTELGDVRQRVLADMMFNLGPERFSTFKKMIAALEQGEFKKATEEMVDSKWHRQVKTRAIRLEAMMRAGTEDDDTPSPGIEPVTVDSAMSFEEAVDGVRFDCPKEQIQELELVEVQYYTFNGELHQGQLLVAEGLKEDLLTVFQIAKDYRFPIHSMIPLSHPRFRKNELWDDELSMEANNTSVFNYREKTGLQIMSEHAYGRAIDINPVQNPYIMGNEILPSGGEYDESAPGTLTSEHPVVQAFLELGWKWGGHWRQGKDYQHFEKPAG